MHTQSRKSYGVGFKGQGLSISLSISINVNISLFLFILAGPSVSSLGVALEYSVAGSKKGLDFHDCFLNVFPWVTFNLARSYMYTIYNS